MMRSSQRNAAPLVLLLAFEIAAIVGLQALGNASSMQIPWSDFAAFVQTSSATEIAMPFVRLTALIMAYWLFASTIFSIIASFSHIPWAARFADTVSLPAVRRVVDGALVLTITATSAGGSAVPAFASEGDVQPIPSDVTTMVVEANDAVSTPDLSQLISSTETEPEADPETTTSSTEPPATTSSSTTPETTTSTTDDLGNSWVPTPSVTNLEAAETDDGAQDGAGPGDVGDPEAGGDGEGVPPAEDDSDVLPDGDGDVPPADDSLGDDTTPTGDAPEEDPSEETAPPPPAASDAPGDAPEVAPDAGLAAGEHRVVAGENLWAIARDAADAANGGNATEAQVRDYWLQLIDANRGTLRSGDPHWIFPGEVIKLPAPATTAS